MAKRKHTPGDIISKFMEAAAVVIATGNTVDKSSPHIGVSEQTFYC